LLRSGLGLTDVDAILLTHLHGDHFLGLPGIFKTYGLRGRERELLLVGPPGLEDLLDTLRPVIGRLPFRLDVMEAGPGAVIREDGMEMRAFHTDHGVRSLGYAMVEEDRPGVFDVDAARALGVTPGPDFGVLQRGGEVTVADGSVVRPDQVMGEAREGRDGLRGRAEGLPALGVLRPVEPAPPPLLHQHRLNLHVALARAPEAPHHVLQVLRGVFAPRVGVGLAATAETFPLVAMMRDGRSVFRGTIEYAPMGSDDDRAVTGLWSASAWSPFGEGNTARTGA
jgi:hypothetical protein